jgi:hypothetical protein
MVPGVSLTNRILKACPGLRKVQLIQEKIDHFRIRYVAADAFQATDLDGLRRDLSNFFPCELQWEFEKVQEIERERSGKTRFCISKVKPSPGPQHATAQ